MEIRKPLGGIEFEYAFGASDRDGVRIPFCVAYDGIESWAHRHAPHLPATNRPGLFLPNGSLFYRDPASGGAHMEVATCEFTNPRDAVLYSGAAHQQMRRFLAGWRAENPDVAQAAFFRTSFDYTLCTSWATHVSVQVHESSHGRRTAWLIPFLVSKIIFGGSGGFRPGRGKLEFCLSPRCYTFQSIDSGGDTERHRGLLGSKGTHHSTPGNRRLHLIGFECLAGQLPRYMEIGGLLLAVAMMEHGLAPPVPALRHPLAALRAFAMDRACRAKVALASGERIGAVEIQRRYLEAACAYLEAPWMPKWAAAFCDSWRKTLDLFADAPHSLTPLLDWAAKLALFEDYAGRHGAGSWEAVAPALMELDMRFAQLNDKPSIFDELESSSLIKSRLYPEEEILKAIDEPPADTRALLRGAAVREMHAAQARGAASWTGVFNYTRQSVLDLQDPHVSSGVDWRPARVHALSPRIHEEHLLRTVQAQRRLVLAMEHYDHGRLASALAILTPVPLAINGERLGRSLLLWTLARLGDAAAWEHLSELESHHSPPSMNHVVDELLVRRFLCVRPPASTERWITIGRATLGPSAEGAAPFFHLSAGTLLCRMGRPEEGMAHLRTVTDSATIMARLHPRLQARAMADEAEAHRLLGDLPQARTLLHEAMRIQNREGYAAELADFSLITQVRLERNPATARHLLAEARQVQERCASRVALARTLLMQARLARDTESIAACRRSLHRLMAQSTALSTDETLQHIFAKWEAWTYGAPDPAGGVLSSHGFWGL